MFRIALPLIASFSLLACGTSTNGTTSASASGTATTGGATSGGSSTGGSTTGGSTGSSTGGSTAATITISSFTFAPANLTVAAGTVVTVKNTDSAPHTATSESAPSAFDGQMASGGFTFNATVSGGASATFTVPANAAHGSVQPYFCNVHKAMMVNANPTITVQ